MVQGKFWVVCMTTLKKATETCTAHSSNYFEFLLSDVPNFAERFAANPQILVLVWTTPPTELPGKNISQVRCSSFSNAWQQTNQTLFSDKLYMTHHVAM